MGWSPKEFFLNAQDFFGGVVPGAILTGILAFAAKSLPPSHAFRELTPPAQWVAFCLASLVIGFLLNGISSGVIDWLYDKTYATAKRRHGDHLLRLARAEAERWVQDISSDSVYEWAKARVLAKDPRIEDQVAILQGISKLFRSMSLMAAVACAILLAERALTWALIAGVLAVIAFGVFATRRWRASRLVYQRLLELEREGGGTARIITP